ncbi:MAG: hypothetical protein WA709_34265, partial [Stellaceae bacterium]
PLRCYNPELFGIIGVARNRVNPSPFHRDRMAKRRPLEKPEPIIVDELGMSERFQGALRKALITPPKHRITPKPKERPASKGRVHKGKTRN